MAKLLLCRGEINPLVKSVARSIGGKINGGKIIDRKFPK